ncbi:sugar phosphate isomerase/epimerase [bacterium]|nr:sugar phosphate isomerase/epimerase [bacterium]
MTRTINRRRALAAGAATVGMATALTGRNAEAGPLPDVWGQDFLMQWSPPNDVKRDLTPGKSHVRLSCSSYRLSNKEGTDYAALVKSIRDAGWAACEAGSAGWRKMPDSEMRELKDVLRQNDLLFYALHVWVNIIHPDAAEREKAQQHVIESVARAEEMGLKFILTHTGGRDAKNKDKPHPENWTRETWEQSVRATRRIIKDTSGSTVALAFEAVNSCNNNTPQSHVRLMKDVGDPRVKVTLDPTNMLHPGVVFRTTELINTCFDLLGEDICYAHGKDVQWNDMLPGLEWVIPGTGVMDYATYLVRLSRMKEPRPLLLEFLKKEQFPEAKKNVEDIARKVGVTIYS